MGDDQKKWLDSGEIRQVNNDDDKKVLTWLKAGRTGKPVVSEDGWMPHLSLEVTATDDPPLSLRATCPAALPCPTWPRKVIRNALTTSENCWAGERGAVRNSFCFDPLLLLIDASSSGSVSSILQLTPQWLLRLFRAR